ncbi:MAG: flippase-like domain-containing protein [Candidatus Omnitrophica bacterium]|nr:flippase-like domain-containing protein [Candidatus Omnitrophota bacterium]
MKQVIAFILSLAIMVVIFLGVDVSQFARYLGEMNIGLLIFGIFFFVPQIALSAWRWQMMVRSQVAIGFWDATGLVLSANALNILLPSRMGDLSKAYFLQREGKIDLKRAMNIVIFEKYIDFAALGVVVLVGILCYPMQDQASWIGLLFSLTVLGLFPVLYFITLDGVWGRSLWQRYRLLDQTKHFLLDTQDYLAELKNNPRLLLVILVMTVVLWFVHLLQFYVIFLALNSGVSVFLVFRLVPLAILVGLIPITIAGVGTRDSAMIYFFSPYEQTARIVGIGLFASFRYFVPGLLGLPFLNHYVTKEKPQSRPEL